jgi:hypothetical protein
VKDGIAHSQFLWDKVTIPPLQFPLIWIKKTRVFDVWNVGRVCISGGKFIETGCQLVEKSFKDEGCQLALG